MGKVESVEQQKKKKMWKFIHEMKGGKDKGRGKREREGGRGG